VVYTETVVGNPTTEIEIFTAADGSITSRKVVKSSGNPDWDTAALNAIDKTAVLPRDESNRVPPSMLIVFSPRTLVGPWKFDATTGPKTSVGPSKVGPRNGESGLITFSRASSSCPD